MSTLYVKQGDVGWKFEDTLTGIDLTGKIVKFMLRQPDGTVLERTATIESVVDKEISYTNVAADFAQIGEHFQEWKVLNGSDPVRIPNQGVNKIVVQTAI